MSGDGVGTVHACAEAPLELESSLNGRSGGGESAAVETVSEAVSEWVGQVGRFLGMIQVALEQSRPKEDASAEVRALSGQLPALIRQCRAQVPTPAMIRTWVKTLSDDSDPVGSPVGSGI